MTYIQERGSTHVYHVNRMSKEEMDHMISLCVHEQPAYCVAACPFKADTKEMLFYAAKGNFKKALAIYEKITPFPMILCNGCTAPCEEKCRLCELGDGISIREVERAIVRYGEPGKRSSVFRIRKKKKAVIFGSGLFPLFLVGELEKKMYPATIYCQEKDYEAYIAAAAPELLESDRKNEVKRLSSMDLSFEFGCSLDLPFIRAKMKEADVVCASEEVAKKLAPEETADAEIMLREQAGIVSGPVRSVMDAAFAAKRVETLDRAGNEKILTDGFNREVVFEPGLRMAQVELEKAKTGEKRSDWQRLLDTLAETDGEVEPGRWRWI